MAATFASIFIGKKSTRTIAKEKPSPENPYLAARREWDERYGNLVTRERNWRVLALFCALSSLITVAGLVWLSARSRVVPFVVAMDSLGRPLAAGPASRRQLVVLERDGKQEMVNYRVKGDTYIVDRLFDHAELILGTGKNAEKVKIERERKN